MKRIILLFLFVSAFVFQSCDNNPVTDGTITVESSKIFITVLSNLSDTGRGANASEHITMKSSGQSFLSSHATLWKERHPNSWKWAITDNNNRRTVSTSRYPEIDLNEDGEYNVDLTVGWPGNAEGSKSLRITVGEGTVNFEEITLDSKPINANGSFAMELELPESNYGPNINFTNWTAIASFTPNPLTDYLTLSSGASGKRTLIWNSYNGSRMQFQYGRKSPLTWVKSDGSIYSISTNRFGMGNKRGSLVEWNTNISWMNPGYGFGDSIMQGKVVSAKVHLTYRIAMIYQILLNPDSRPQYKINSGEYKDMTVPSDGSGFASLIASFDASGADGFVLGRNKIMFRCAGEYPTEEAHETRWWDEDNEEYEFNITRSGSTYTIGYYGPN